MNTISTRLGFYQSITLAEIELVYRPNERVSWGKNRKMYDGNCDLQYNHRSILPFEVVFDFDSDDIEENVENSFKVITQLEEELVNPIYSVWSTGGKGIHIHTLWKDLESFKDLTLMKKTIMKHFAYGMKIDYQLASKHLVRMEYGVYEKVRNVDRPTKTPIYDVISLDEYLNIVPSNIISEYVNELNSYMIRRIDAPANVDNDLLREFLDGKYVIRDGREKFLYYLIHALKGKMPQNEVTDRLTSWYQYCGGTKLTREHIRQKVLYHWDKKYSFGVNFFNNLMKDYDVKLKE